jgi:hypothetical protein
MHWSAKAKKDFFRRILLFRRLTLYSNHYWLNLQKKIGFCKSGGAGQHLFGGRVGRPLVVPK